MSNEILWMRERGWYDKRDRTICITDRNKRRLLDAEECSQTLGGKINSKCFKKLKVKR